MQCNIDHRGRRIRAVGGGLSIAAAIVLIAIAPRSVVAWIGAVILLAAGLFQLFEAAKGWCALRAMGVRTPW